MQPTKSLAEPSSSSAASAHREEVEQKLQALRALLSAASSIQVSQVHPEQALQDTGLSAKLQTAQAGLQEALLAAETAAKQLASAADYASNLHVPEANSKANAASRSTAFPATDDELIAVRSLCRAPMDADSCQAHTSPCSGSPSTVVSA